MEEAFQMYLIENNGYTDFIPLTAGQEYCAPRKGFGPAFKHNHSFHYVVSGKGTFCVDGKAYTVSAGQCFYIREGQLVEYYADETDPWHYIWIGFLGTAAQRFQALPSPVFPYGRDTFLHLISRIEQTPSTKAEVAISALFAVLGELFSAEVRRNDYVEAVCHYVDFHYQKDIRVEEIARAVGLNRHYLTSLFHKHKHMSVVEYLVQTRLTQAYALLMQGYGVAETAGMVGYRDMFHFSKMFKKRYGVSPSQIKKENWRHEEEYLQKNEKK